MSNYEVTRLDEIEELDDGREPWRPVRHHFGIQSFGINTWTGKEAGDRIINEHDEADDADSQEELYLVLHGRARFEIDGDQVDAPTDTFVFVRPAARRTAFAEEPGTTILAIGATPGKAFEVFGWETWSELRPLYDSGEYEQAADRGRTLVEAHPEYAGVAYNVACVESLAGRKEDALEHLRLAVKRSDRLRNLAAKDSDFDPIREEPGFKELVG